MKHSAMKHSTRKSSAMKLSKMKLSKTRYGIRRLLTVLAVFSAPVLAQPVALVNALPGLTYTIDTGSRQSFTLQDGRLSAPEKRIEVRLLEPRAFGDIDGDGFTDAAVVLLYDGGGSGRFVYLAPVLSRPEGQRTLPAILLGDRVPVKAVSIDKGQVQVTVCERAADAPMASRDCTDVTRSYVLDDERMVSVQAAAAARDACLARARELGQTEPRVEAQRYVGGPIWLLRLQGRDDAARHCSYNIVTKQADVD
jgi:hypothetical protein